MIWCPCIDIHKKFVCLKVAMQCEGRISKCWDNPDEKAWWWLWQKQFMQMLSAHNCEGKEECAWHGHQLKRTGWHKTFCCEQGGGLKGQNLLYYCVVDTLLYQYLKESSTLKSIFTLMKLFSRFTPLFSLSQSILLSFFFPLYHPLSRAFSSPLSVYLSIYLSIYTSVCLSLNNNFLVSAYQGMFLVPGGRTGDNTVNLHNNNTFIILPHSNSRSLIITSFVAN